MSGLLKRYSLQLLVILFLWL